VNHRNGPRFHYPAAVEDVQRAVRYIRFHAKDYGVDPARIGAVGYSSGAYLAAMLGVLYGTGDSADADPINLTSAKVQCVVASATPTDLQLAGSGDPNVASFMGQIRPRAAGLDSRPDLVAVRAYREASPITHVSASSAPTLLLHGDADPIVSFHQSEVMEAAMRRVGVDVRLVRLPGGDHGFGGDAARHPELAGLPR
jgi:acetyl esterase/lipase